MPFRTVWLVLVSKNFESSLWELELNETYAWNLFIDLKNIPLHSFR